MNDKDNLIKQQHDFIQMALMPRILTNEPTLRDKFAMAALSSGRIEALSIADAAKIAYELADAMMEERK